MAIDREKFILAGINHIYQLDNFNKSAVYAQVANEFDEILALNEPQVLENRSKHFGIGESSDYLNRLVTTGEGDVIAGIRHLGGDRDCPFVFVWPSFQIKSIKKIVESVFPYFEVFKPKTLSYWTRPDCNGLPDSGESNKKVIQQRFIGKIEDMPKRDVLLTAAKSYYDWYESEYQIFHQKKPEFKNRITCNSKELMDACQKDGLLFFLYEGDNKAGLIAGEKEVFLGKPSVYLNEILIGHKYRQKGFANDLLAGFVNILDADYFICSIDSDNIPSTRTALRSGQSVFSQEIFVRV